MATVPKTLYHGQPTSSAATVYTVPASTTAVIRHLRCSNKDASVDYDLELWMNGTDDAHAITPKITIPRGEMWEDDVFIPLATGETLSAKASTSAKLTLVAGGVEIT